LTTGRALRFLDEAVFELRNADPTPFGDVEHCLDTTHSVSDDGQSIDVTEHLSYGGSGDFPQCPGTGNDGYDFTYTVTIHLKGTPENTAARAAAER